MAFLDRKMKRRVTKAKRRMNSTKRHVTRVVKRDVMGRPTGWQVLLDMGLGAVAGALGTFAMGQTQKVVPTIEPSRRTQLPAKRGEELPPATELAAKKALEPLAVQVEGEQQKTLGHVVHWGFGATLGSLYGLLDGRVKLPVLVSGLVFGLAVWAFGDEIALPKLGLSKQPEEYPLDSHVRALVSHLAYGATTDVGFRALRKALPVV